MFVSEEERTLKGDLRSSSLRNALRSFRGRSRRVHVGRRRGHRRPGGSRGGSGERNSPSVEGRRCRSPRVSTRWTADHLQSGRRDRGQWTAVSRRVKVGRETTVAGTRQACGGVATGPESRRRAQRFAPVHVRCTKSATSGTEASLKEKMWATKKCSFIVYKCYNSSWLEGKVYYTTELRIIFPSCWICSNI